MCDYKNSLWYQPSQVPVLSGIVMLLNVPGTVLDNEISLHSKRWHLVTRHLAAWQKGHYIKKKCTCVLLTGDYRWSSERTIQQCDQYLGLDVRLVWNALSLFRLSLNLSKDLIWNLAFVNTSFKCKNVVKCACIWIYLWWIYTTKEMKVISISAFSWRISPLGTVVIQHSSQLHGGKKEEIENSYRKSNQTKRYSN